MTEKVKMHELKKVSAGSHFLGSASFVCVVLPLRVRVRCLLGLDKSTCLTFMPDDFLRPVRPETKQIRLQRVVPSFLVVFSVNFVDFTSCAKLGLS